MLRNAGKRIFTVHVIDRRDRTILPANTFIWTHKKRPHCFHKVLRNGMGWQWERRPRAAQSEAQDWAASPGCGSVSARSKQAEPVMSHKPGCHRFQPSVLVAQVRTRCTAADTHTFPVSKGGKPGAAEEVAVAGSGNRAALAQSTAQQSWILTLRWV